MFEPITKSNTIHNPKKDCSNFVLIQWIDPVNDRVTPDEIGTKHVFKETNYKKGDIENCIITNEQEHFVDILFIDNSIAYNVKKDRYRIINED
jgi:hypothetical protein